MIIHEGRPFIGKVVIHQADPSVVLLIEHRRSLPEPHYDLKGFPQSTGIEIDLRPQGRQSLYFTFPENLRCALLAKAGNLRPAPAFSVRC
jgi:hypothetical protein